MITEGIVLEFCKSKIDLLKEYIYYSDVHDSKNKKAMFNNSDNTVVIRLFNSISKSGCKMVFGDVKVSLYTMGEFTGYKTVSSLTIEEDYSVLGECFDDDGGMSDYIYLLFQTASGDELHIVAKTVCIDKQCC